MADPVEQSGFRKGKKSNQPNRQVAKRQHSRVLKENVIYISTKSNIQYLTQKCEKLLKNDEKEITLYCMGSAIQRGILLALKLCDEHPLLHNYVSTYTTEIKDDIEPATDEDDYEVQSRNSSAVCIKLVYKDPLEVTT